METIRMGIDEEKEGVREREREKGRSNLRLTISNIMNVIICQICYTNEYLYAMPFPHKLSLVA